MSTLLYYERPQNPEVADGDEFSYVRCNRITRGEDGSLGIDLSLYTDYGHHWSGRAVIERTVTIEPAFYAGTAQEIGLFFMQSEAMDLDAVIREIPPHAKSSYDNLKYRERSIGRFTVSDDGTDITLMLAIPCDPIEGFRNIVMIPESGLSQTAYMLRHSEVFRRVLEKRWKKNELIRQIDITNSLSYLETACDLLSKVCVSLLESRTDRTDDENTVLELLKLNLLYSTVDVKPLEKTRDEFREHKNKLHTLKMRYYNQ